MEIYYKMSVSMCAPTQLHRDKDAHRVCALCNDQY